jgi:deoxycytidylate deaminase
MTQRMIPASKPSRRQDQLARHRDWLARAAALAAAPHGAGGSPHPSVKVGAVLVSPADRQLAAASNRFASGIDRRRPERYASGTKSLWINCAEQVALAEALRRGVKVKDARLYVTLEPCAVCAGLIAEAGIREVYVPVGALRRYARLKAKWKHSIEVGMVKLAEAGVKVIAVDAEVRGQRSEIRDQKLEARS